MTSPNKTDKSILNLASFRLARYGVSAQMNSKQNKTKQNTKLSRMDIAQLIAVLTVCW